MSSLAAARADGYYYDPTRFDPKKRGRDTVNALAGSHALGDRAKRLKSEGILVIRFEMPYDCWCEGCGIHWARGVRFNADKKMVGNYFSTPIWEFSFKCTNPNGCNTVIVIRTDPKASDYEFVSGARKKDRGEGAEDAVVLEYEDTVTRGRAKGEALSGLEKTRDDMRRAQAHAARLHALADDSDRRYGLDRDRVNAQARGLARDRALQDRIAAAQGAAAGLAVPLAPALEDDQAVEDRHAHFASEAEPYDEDDEDEHEQQEDSEATAAKRQWMAATRGAGHDGGDSGAESSASQAWTSQASSAAGASGLANCDDRGMSQAERALVLAQPAIAPGRPRGRDDGRGAKATGAGPDTSSRGLSSLAAAGHYASGAGTRQAPGVASGSGPGRPAGGGSGTHGSHGSSSSARPSSSSSTGLARVSSSQAGTKISSLVASGLKQLKDTERQVHKAAQAANGRKRMLMLMPAGAASSGSSAGVPSLGLTVPAVRAAALASRLALPSGPHVNNTPAQQLPLAPRKGASR